VHLFGNAPICASIVLECSCGKIHRYVAAPCKHSHEESLIQPSRIPILRASRLGTIISLQTYRQPIWPTVLSSKPAWSSWGLLLHSHLRILPSAELIRFCFSNTVKTVFSIRWSSVALTSFLNFCEIFQLSTHTGLDSVIYLIKSKGEKVLIRP
jgi:hypothetical protein